MPPLIFSTLLRFRHAFSSFMRQLMLMLPLRDSIFFFSPARAHYFDLRCRRLIAYACFRFHIGHYLLSFSPIATADTPPLLPMLPLSAA